MFLKNNCRIGIVLKQSIGIVLSLCCFIGFAQQSPYFKHYGIENGLSQGTVFDFVFDQQGYLWVATNDGLNRFDGYDFTVYKQYKRGDATLNLNKIEAVAIESPHHLWITSSNGLDLIDTRTLESTYYITSQGYLNVVYSDLIRDEVYYYTHSSGIIIHNKASNTFTPFTKTNKFKALQLDTSDLSMIFPMSWKSGKHILVNKLSNNRYLVYNYKKELFRIFQFPYPLSTISRECEIDDEHFIVFDKATIYIFNLSNNVCKTYSNTLEIEPANAIDAKQDKHGMVWISTYDKGLVRLDTKNGAWSHFKHIPDNSNSIASDNLLYMDIDSNNNLWIGTIAHGLDMINLDFNKFNLISNKSLTSPLSSNFIRSIHLNKDSILFVGTNDAGLDVFNLNTKTYHHYNVRNNTSARSSGSTALTIYEDSLQKIWIGTYGSGLWLYEKNTLKNIVRQNPYENDLVVNSIVSISKNSVLFTASTEVGLLKYSTTKYDTAWIKLPVLIEYLFKNKDRIWAVSRNNLYILTEKDNRFRIKLYNRFNATIKYVYEINQQNVLIATTAGLYLLKNNLVISTFDESNGLLNQNIYGIVPENDSCYWISTNKGLSKINILSKKIENFTLNNGLQGNEFNTGAFHKSYNNLIFFGGMNGINYFPANLNTIQNSTNSILINTITVNDVPVLYQDTVLVLSHTENTISFDFSNNNFTSPDLNVFNCKLSGVDENWVNLKSKHYIRYTQLKPGKYELQLRVKQNRDWGPVKTFSFVIKAPFWLRPWFLVLSCSTLITLVIVIIRYISRYRLQQELMEMRVVQKIEEDRSRISRELHDNIGSQLSLIISNIETMGMYLNKNNVDGTAELIHSTHAHSKLIIQQLRETIWTLRNNEIELNQFQQRVENYVRNFFIDKTTQVHFENSTEKNILLSPIHSLTIFRIIQEAVNNAFKYAKAKHLLLTFSSKNNHLDISIEDDGIGFELSKVKEGYGLENIHIRATEIKAKLKIESELKKGTKIILKLRLK